jgi:hypothetical protein
MGGVPKQTSSSPNPEEFLRSESPSALQLNDVNVSAKRLGIPSDWKTSDQIRRDFFFARREFCFDASR